MDDRVNRDTRARFMEDLIGVIGVEFRELRTVDDVDAPGAGLRGRGFVEGCARGVGRGGGDVVEGGGGERCVGDDCLGSGGRCFFGGLFRVAGGYLGVSTVSVRWVL
jgi:hypothetical protein